jgi:DNA-binding NarL/FixJ family response regulator
MHPSAQYADNVVKVAASGYLTKEGAPDHLISTIRRIFYGENSFRPQDMVH